MINLQGLFKKVTKRALSVTLALFLLLSVLPLSALALKSPISAATGGISDIDIRFGGAYSGIASQEAGAYNQGDIAIINALIANKGLNWTPAPSDGSYVPEDWNVWWSEGITDLRIAELNVGASDLTGTLDMSGLTALRYLYCSYNQLTALNVGGLTGLECIYCSDNLLETLDVSGLINLRYLYCNNNRLNVLNIGGLPYLEQLFCYNNLFETLDVSGLANLRSLYCSYNRLTTLVVSGLARLEELDCYGNLLEMLDLGGLFNLRCLYCDYNRLTALNVSMLASLQYLYCIHNRLAALDVSGLSNLQYLNCNNNLLTALTLDANAEYYYIDVTYNWMPDVGVVKGKSIDWNGLNFKFDPQYGLQEAGTYNTGDIAIINALIATKGLNWTPAPPDGSYVPADWNVWWSEGIKDLRITELEMVSSGLTGKLDMRGLAALRYLYCSYNQLTEMDVGGLSDLEYIYCSGNLLETLDVSGLAKLQYLYCSYNQLIALNLNGLVKLEGLSCYGNLLKTLDVSGLAKLRYLDCDNNRLTSLDVSGLSDFEALYCSGNLLETLDVDGLVMLEYLYCSDNLLETLNVGGLTTLRNLNCSYNRLASLDAGSLADLTVLHCYNNLLETLDVSGLTNLQYLNCSNNLLTALALEANANYYYIDASYNFMANTGAVTGKQITWEGYNFVFYPQNTPPIPTGVTVSGVVCSYNPNNATTLILTNINTGEEFPITIAKTEGSGLVWQSFAFESVKPGTYMLTVTKAVHTDFTVKNIIVGNTDVDLTKDSRLLARRADGSIALLCGDLNSDGMINDGDLTILWSYPNYNRDADNGTANPDCDLNGDGLINDGDLTILWLTTNYNKGEVVIT